MGFSNWPAHQMAAFFPCTPSRVLLAPGCDNLAVRNPEWEGEYCSNECVVRHCKNVFDAYTTQTMAEHLAQVAS